MAGYQEGQFLRGSDGNIYVVRGGTPVLANQSPEPSRSAITTLTPPDPYKANEDRRAANRDARDAATAPYDARKAAADAAKAETDAEKARRDLQAQQATASPEQQRAMADLSNDEILSAIAKARGDVDKGYSAGWWARLPETFQPQSAIDLSGSLNTIASRLTLDKLAQLKQASPTGASGLGVLTEKEGALLRDSVSSLGQTQSPERLRDNINAVEEHYRNLLALSQGKDYRDPAVAKEYGMAQDGAPVVGGAGATLLPPGSTQAVQDNPLLRGVNQAVADMIQRRVPADQIRGYLRERGVDPEKVKGIDEAIAFLAKNPTYSRGIGVNIDDQYVPQSGGQQLLNSLAQSSYGAGTIGATDALTFGTLDNMSANPALTRTLMDQNAKESPIASTVGGIAGSIAGSQGVGKVLGMFARGGKAASLLRNPLTAEGTYGFGYGTGSADDGNRILGGLEGAALGVIGAKAGEKGAKAIGNVVRGVSDPMVLALDRAGVRMTPGQMLGGTAKAREDRLMGFGGLGDKIRAQTTRSMQDWNRAVFREGGSPIGYVPDQIGVNGKRALENAIGNEYTDILDGRIFQVDVPAMQAFQSAGAKGANIGGELAGEVNNTFNSRVRDFIDPNTGVMSGRNFQAAQQGLREDLSSFSGKPRYDLYRDAVGDIEGALTGMVDRQAPGLASRLGKANDAWGKMKIIEDAVLAGKNTGDMFTPSQLAQSAVSNTKKFGGKSKAASMDRAFYDLQNAGQAVLPSKIPDSGTAGRAREGSLTARAIGAALDAARAPLYSETLSPVMRAALLERPDAVRAAGDIIVNNAAIGRMFGAGLARNRLLPYLQK